MSEQTNAATAPVSVPEENLNKALANLEAAAAAPAVDAGKGADTISKAVPKDGDGEGDEGKDKKPEGKEPDGDEPPAGGEGGEGGEGEGGEGGEGGEPEPDGDEEKSLANKGDFQKSMTDGNAAVKRAVEVSPFLNSIAERLDATMTNFAKSIAASKTDARTAKITEALVPVVKSMAETIIDLSQRQRGMEELMEKIAGQPLQRKSISKSVEAVDRKFDVNGQPQDVAKSMSAPQQGQGQSIVKSLDGKSEFTLKSLNDHLMTIVQTEPGSSRANVAATLVTQIEAAQSLNGDLLKSLGLQPVG